MKGMCFKEHNPRTQIEVLLSGDPICKINNKYIKNHMAATYRTEKNGTRTHLYVQNLKKTSPDTKS